MPVLIEDKDILLIDDSSVLVSEETLGSEPVQDSNVLVMQPFFLLAFGSGVAPTGEVLFQIKIGTSEYVRGMSFYCDGSKTSWAFGWSMEDGLHPDYEVSVTNNTDQTLTDMELRLQYRQVTAGV